MIAPGAVRVGLLVSGILPRRHRLCARGLVGEAVVSAARRAARGPAGRVRGAGIALGRARLAVGGAERRAGRLSVVRVVLVVLFALLVVLERVVCVLQVLEALLRGGVPGVFVGMRVSGWGGQQTAGAWGAGTNLACGTPS